MAGNESMQTASEARREDHVTNGDVEISVVSGAHPKAQKMPSAFSSVLRIRRPSFLTPQDELFVDVDQFITRQRKFRDENLTKAGGQKVLMLSHCWRDQETQGVKRKLIATLGLNGWSYWADFLDLQATGPVSWRKEIEDGIRDCAKVVLFVDKAYLLSFNCLQEVAFAATFCKPIVVMMLDQEAMELLTRPEGAEAAWRELQPYEGKPLTPGVEDDNPLSLGKVSEMFEMIAGINVCMCRPMDFANDSDKVVLHRMHDFVSVELAYQREHAQLQSKALEWEQNGRHNSRLLRGAAVLEWEVWIKRAQQQQQIPAPTELQQTYVSAGKQKSKQRRRCLQVLMVVTVVVAILAGIQWSYADRARRAAERNEAVTEGVRVQERAAAAEAQVTTKLLLLQDSMELQEIARAKAEEEALVATARQYLFIAAADRFLNGFGQAALMAAVDIAPRIPPPVQAEIWEAAATMGRTLQMTSNMYKVRDVLTVAHRSHFHCRPVGRASPDRRWVVCHSDPFAEHLRLLQVDRGLVFQAQGPADYYSLLDVSWTESAMVAVVHSRWTKTTKVFQVELPANATDTAHLQLVLELNHSAVGLQHATVYGAVRDARRGLVLVGLRDEEAGKVHLVAANLTDAVQSVVDVQEGCPVGDCRVQRDGSFWVTLHNDDGSVSLVDSSQSLDALSASRFGAFRAGTHICGARVSPSGLMVAVVACETNLLAIFRDQRAWFLASLTGPLGDLQNGEFLQMEWNFDETLLAVYRQQDLSNRIAVFEPSPDGIGPEPALRQGEKFADLMWMSNSDLLLFVRSEHTQVVAYRLETPDAIATVRFSQYVNSVQWAHGGRRFATADQSGELRVWNASDHSSRVVARDLQTAQALWTWDDQWLSISQIDLNELVQKNKSLAKGGLTHLSNVANGTERVLDTGISCLFSLSEPAHITGSVAWICHTDWGPSSRFGVWNITDESEQFHEVQLPASRLAYLAAPRWTAGDRYIVVSSLLTPSSLNTSAVCMVRAHDLHIQCLTLPFPQVQTTPAPDAQRVLVAANEQITTVFDHLGVLELGPDGLWQYRALGGTDTKVPPLTSLIWAPGGRRMWTAVTDGTVREWDLDPQAGQSCAISWPLLRNLKSSPGPNAMSVTARAGGAHDILVGENTGLYRLMDTKGYVELVRGQSLGVTREELDAHFGLDQSGATSQICWSGQTAQGDGTMVA